MKFTATVICVACLANAGLALALPCVEPDNGNATIDLPPTCADGYAGTMQIVDGLPAGSTIDITAKLVCSAGVEAPGGSLGGHTQTFDAELEMTMQGTGALAGFNRWITVPLFGTITESAPRTPGDPVQNFDQAIINLDGELFGDPDFCTLRIRSGSDFGLPSPGATTLTDQGGSFNVDSFFDITWQIEFVGCPGSVLDGMSGTTTDSSTFAMGGDPVAETTTTWGSIKAMFSD